MLTSLIITLQTCIDNNLNNGRCCNLVFCPFVCADVLCFDNSYSILQSKKVSYKVEVLPPADGCGVLAADEAGGCGDRELRSPCGRVH